jgi:hypothetical protein
MVQHRQVTIGEVSIHTQDQIFATAHGLGKYVDSDGGLREHAGENVKIDPAIRIDGVHSLLTLQSDAQCMPLCRVMGTVSCTRQELDADRTVQYVPTQHVKFPDS